FPPRCRTSNPKNCSKNSVSATTSVVAILRCLQIICDHPFASCAGCHRRPALPQSCAATRTSPHVLKVLAALRPGDFPPTRFSLPFGHHLEPRSFPLSNRDLAHCVGQRADAPDLGLEDVAIAERAPRRQPFAAAPRRA